MRRILVIVATVMMVSGCTTAYWKDRGYDMADIATLTFGLGGGAFVQVGPRPFGYGFIMDDSGIEDGKVGSVSYLTALQGFAERFAVYDSDDMRVKRGKLPPLPKDGDETGSLPIMPHHWSQIRFFAGVTFFSMTVGVNPGELADFASGWLGIDIYGDDLESRVVKDKGSQDGRKDFATSRSYSRRGLLRLGERKG